MRVALDQMDTEDTTPVGDDGLVIALRPAQLAGVLAIVLVLIVLLRARRAR